MLHRPNHYRVKYSYGKTGMGNKHNGHSSTIQKSSTTTACTSMETETMEMDTRQKKYPLARGRTHSKSSAVHFNPSVVVHCNNDGAFSEAESASYWLSSTDFSSIRNKMMMTLNIMKLTSHPTSSSASSASSASSLLLPASYCSRGIEHYALDNTGCLDTSVVVRRQNAIRVVLNEQAFQRQQQQQQQQQHEDDVDININTIRDLYAQETYLNMHYGIYAGNIDSQEALKVYVGQPQQQQNQRIVLTPPNKNSKNKFVSLPASSLSSFPLPRLFPSKSEPEHGGMISKAA